MAHDENLTNPGHQPPSGFDGPALQATDDDPVSVELDLADAEALEYSPADAASLDANVDSSLADVGPSRSLAGDAWKRFRRNKLAMFGLGLVLFLVLVGLIGPFVVQDPSKLSKFTKEAPTNQHLFGTDELGHDVLSRTVYGIRLSLFIGFVATLAETIFGLAVGAIAGWYRGFADTVLMRFVDIMLGVPYLILALALIAAIGRGVTAVIITLAATAWLQTARTVRAGFIQVRDLEYVEAAKTTGVPTRRIIIRHVMPNVFQPVVVLAAIGIGSAILAEAALSFLGVGVDPSAPSLGQAITNSQAYFQEAPHLLFFPGITIILLVLGFLLVGDGLRDALDVKDI